MDVTPLISSKAKIIQSYGAEGFRISGEIFVKSVAVFPETVESFSTLPEFLSSKPDIDVLVYGSSRGFDGLDFAGRKACKEQGIILEAMDLGAACRTYNVLMAEGRRVAAVLIFDTQA